MNSPVTLKNSLVAVARITLRHFLIARKNTVYLIPELYDAGVLGQLSRRQNLAQGLARIVYSSMPSNRNVVLDLGAGTGIFSIELARIGLATIGTDVHLIPLNRLRERALQDGLDPMASAIQADMNTIFPFGSDIFDAVTSLRATRYIEDFNSFLSEILRVLKPGGVLVLPVFFIDTIPWRRRSKKGIFQETSSRALKRALMAAGFAVEYGAAQKYRHIIAKASPEGDVPFYYRPRVIIARKPAAESQRVRQHETAEDNFILRNAEVNQRTQ